MSQGKGCAAGSSANAAVIVRLDTHAGRFFVEKCHASPFEFKCRRICLMYCSEHTSLHVCASSGQQDGIRVPIDGKKGGAACENEVALWSDHKYLRTLPPGHKVGRSRRVYY